MGDVSSFCQSNPTDSACSLWRMCKANTVLSRSSPYCDAWSLLHSACARKKESLQQDCVSFNLLCGDLERTAVSQCIETRHAGVQNLIPSADASAAVAKLCAEMPDMEGCSSCTASYCADPLLSLGKICSSMSMDGCEGWTTMCSGVPSGSLGEICGSEGGETCTGVMQVRAARVSCLCRTQASILFALISPSALSNPQIQNASPCLLQSVASLQRETFLQMDDCLPSLLDKSLPELYCRVGAPFDGLVG